ncbi:8-oxo-dGTP pyrophosphatase MutT (NUDIX family) [Nocardiopsis mwathae]|uniref:8-oxo-dGTP pyrophosphatase MutT (NUDIX family) n=1 Tax=Nocardiopsis mwathae TaxID=1472723 RepID=A0A7X0D784_9ACTN|nr:CoA pyrophosphatase [Nocardiopsis mwathae]MBB6174168.1 8-oxo-dGTP pyrophosphatase MutT (NUDIX family) [Nocardiopsis mwathae]
MSGRPSREPGAAPEWLARLADAARRMPVPAVMRPPESGGRPSAVLILFAEGDGGPDVLLIQRNNGLRRHSGQPAFPGGRIEPSDTGPEEAALREAEEETGLDPAGIATLGLLPELYIERSGFRVAPVLAWWHTPSAVHPADSGEVAAVCRVPVSELADPANRVRVRHPDGTIGPAFRVRGMLVWGFTAGILHRLLVLGGWETPMPNRGSGPIVPIGDLVRPDGGTA